MPKPTPNLKFEMQEMNDAELRRIARCPVRSRHWFSYRGGAGRLVKCHYCQKPKDRIQAAQRELRDRMGSVAFDDRTDSR